MQLIRQLTDVIASTFGRSPVRLRRRRMPVASPIIAILFAVSMLSGVAYASDTVIVVPSRQGGAYQEFIDSFAKSIDSGKGSRSIAIRVVESKAITKESYDELYSKSQLIVTVGTTAAQKVLKLNPSVPVLHTLIPRSSYSTLVSGNSGRNNSSIYLDQPLERRIELVGVLLPQKKTIGVVLGPGSSDLQTELKAVAASKGVTETEPGVAALARLLR